MNSSNHDLLAQHDSDWAEIEQQKRNLLRLTHGLPDDHAFERVIEEIDDQHRRLSMTDEVHFQLEAWATDRWISHRTRPGHASKPTTSAQRRLGEVLSNPQPESRDRESDASRSA